MYVEQVIYEFCNRVLSTSSTNEKKKIVAEYKNNEDVKRFLRFLYDKTVVTGISNTKLVKNLRGKCIDIPQGYTDILSVIDYLTSHNTGSDVDIAVCQNYFEHILTKNFMYDEQYIDMGDMLNKIITKSLKLGIDTKLVNTAIPGLIRVHEVQQALKYCDGSVKQGEWFCLSQKLNGNRATYIDGKILSRQGKEFSNINHIIDELNKLNSSMDAPYVFDGEIIRKNIDNVSDNTNFTIGTGILNSDAEDKTALSFVIFDMLPLAEFNKGESVLTYKDRVCLMQTVAAMIAPKSASSTDSSLAKEREQFKFNHVEVVPFLYEGTDQSMINKCLARMDAEGKEGCMLARDVTYKCKRHSGLLKVKTFYTMDLVVVDMQTGTGKNENTLGNLVVKYKDNFVGVGSGFSDEQRAEIWSNKEKYIGRIAEVKYKDITHDKGTGKESLQFPVFVRFREEGKKVSYN